jgi:predicted MPP superfamily phosphohydrolase
MDQPSLKILHFSDLHYGRITDQAIRELDRFIDLHRQEIHLIIFTGDFTQRARTSEFQSARGFLDNLKIPFFIIPGNHDVPLYNLFLRFLFPYRKYMRHLGNISPHFYEDERIAIYGLWTVNNFSVKEGIVRKNEMTELREKFAEVPVGKIKIIAAHHPLTDLASYPEILKVKPDLMLWGHEHQSLVEYVDGPNSPLIVAAGTAISSRTRAEANSFNMIEIGKGLKVVTYVLGEQGFEIQVSDEAHLNL